MPKVMTDSDEMRRYSNALRMETESEIEKITQKLLNGQLKLGSWQRQMLRIIWRGNTAQYVTGRGGNVGRLEFLKARVNIARKEMVTQFKHLRRFAGTIKSANKQGKPLTFVMARSKMYARSTQAEFWRSAIAVELPQVPRDGNTQCLTNCQCRLKFDYVRDDNGKITAVLVWWNVRPAEHCPDCLKLQREWNPLRVETTGNVRESSIEQAIHIMLRNSEDLSGIPLETFNNISREIHEMWNIYGVKS